MNEQITLLGIPLIILGGAFLFLILTYQVLTGLGKIKAPLKYHKTLGIIIFFIAIFHAVWGIVSCL